MSGPYTQHLRAEGDDRAICSGHADVRACRQDGSSHQVQIPVDGEPNAWKRKSPLGRRALFGSAQTLNWYR